MVIGVVNIHRCDYNNIINIFQLEPDTSKNAPAQRLNKHLTMKS